MGVVHRCAELNGATQSPHSGDKRGLDIHDKREEDGEYLGNAPGGEEKTLRVSTS